MCIINTANYKKPSLIVDINSKNINELCFTPSSIRDTTEFQPLTKKVDSDSIKFISEKSHLQLYDVNSIQDYDLPIKFDTSQKEYFSQRDRVIIDKSELIEDHLDRRVQLFFQQAIMCYNTPFIYEAEGAEDQYGLGRSIDLGNNKQHRTQAAHSSTFPCLYAFPKDNDGKKIQDKKFVFLKYSDFYKKQNSTIELPIEVNQTDTQIDGKSCEHKLRTKALKIINMVALGKITPEKATNLFVKTLQKRLFTMLSNQEEKRYHQILDIYSRRLTEIQKGINENANYFDQILDLNLPGEEDLLRQVVYAKRYKMLQTAAFIESKISKKIFEYQKNILKCRSKSLKSVDYRLRYVLLKNISNSQSFFFERLFCCSLNQLKVNITKSEDQLRRRENTIENFYMKNKNSINNLINEINELRKELECLEFQYRADLFKGLRTDYKKWTQKKFVNCFKFFFPNETMSQSMVSRFENPIRNKTNRNYSTPINQRLKLMDLEKAQKIAKTFEVDAGIFAPGLLSSVY